MMVMIRFSVSTYYCLVVLVVVCIQSMCVLSLQHLHHLKINRHVVNRSQRLNIYINHIDIQKDTDTKYMKNFILSGSRALVALSLLASMPMQSVLAVDSIDGGISPAIISNSSNNNELTDIEQARVLRKLQLQNKSTTTTDNGNSIQERDNNTPRENDESYLNSLRKEQGKQQSMKKTKAQRAKDLCESLGRGC
jgi:hypothetical protein